MGVGGRGEREGQVRSQNLATLAVVLLVFKSEFLTSLYLETVGLQAGDAAQPLSCLCCTRGPYTYHYADPKLQALVCILQIAGKPCSECAQTAHQLESKNVLTNTLLDITICKLIYFTVPGRQMLCKAS